MTTSEKVEGEEEIGNHTGIEKEEYTLKDETEEEKR